MKGGREGRKTIKKHREKKGPLIGLHNSARRKESSGSVLVFLFFVYVVERGMGESDIEVAIMYIHIHTHMHIHAHTGRAKGLGILVYTPRRGSFWAYEYIILLATNRS